MIEKKDKDAKKLMVDFDMLYDIDMACVLYLIDNYGKSKYFNDWVYCSNMYHIKYLTLTRTEKNPLSIIFKPEYLNRIDGIYEELLTNKYEEVIKYAGLTDILSVLKGTEESTSSIKVTVNCKNLTDQLQIEAFPHTRKWNTVIELDDVSGFNAIFVHDIDSITNYKGVSGKAIYLYDYALNYEDFFEKKYHPFAVLLSKTNAIKYISPYSNFEFPE